MGTVKKKTPKVSDAPMAVASDGSLRECGDDRRPHRPQKDCRAGPGSGYCDFIGVNVTSHETTVAKKWMDDVTSELAEPLAGHGRCTARSRRRGSSSDRFARSPVRPGGHTHGRRVPALLERGCGA